MFFGRKKEQSAEPKEKEITVSRLSIVADGHKLFGELARPKRRGKLPLVICCHGFNGSYEFFKGDIAERLAKSGCAVYYFDFYAGSKHNKSGGTLLEQSPLDESRQLMDLIRFFQTQDYVDTKKIFLFGESQGGFVTAYTAAQCPSEIKGMILYYPALCIMDDVRKKYASFQELPEKIPLFGLTLSPHYYDGLYDVDIYEEMAKYRGPVLLIHGTLDSVVPVSYGRRAAEAFDNCEYHEFSGQNHGFNINGKVKALAYVLEFLTKHK